MEDKEAKKKKSNSLKSILGGDILATDFFRRQTKLQIGRAHSFPTRRSSDLHS